jgi:tetratricopeptide (TPR) repeat protein
MDQRERAGVPDERRLDSWKEIAAFFRRDPRTVKRWEKERALPIHRIPGKGRSGVYAHERELRRWLENQPVDGAALEPESRAEPEATGDGAPSRGPWRSGLLLMALALLAGAGLWVARTVHRSIGSVHAADPEAAQGYLKCRYAWSKRSAEKLQDAAACFEGLIARAPRFAAAYAGLADSYNLLREYSPMPDSQAFPRAIAAARKAVELDPDSSLGHRALAFAAFNWSFDVPTAEREFRTAIALDPRDAEAHHWFATSLMLLGRDVEALEQIGLAQQLEPTSSSIVADRGFILYAAGQFQEALEVERQLARSEPDLVSPHRYLAEMSFHRGDYSSYLAESRRFVERVGDRDALSALAAQERAFAAGGSRGLLEQLLEQREERHAQGSIGAYPLAQVESLLGLREQAVSHLEEAVARHEPLAMAMGIDPPLANVRGERRFQDLVAQLGLPPGPPVRPSSHALR